MNIKLIIGIVIVVFLAILYFLLRIILLSVSRKRKYKEIEQRIKKGIKPLSKEIKSERRHSVSEYEECIQRTRDKDVKAWGRWVLAQFYHNNPHRKKDYLEKAIECYSEIAKDFSDYPFYEESLFRLGNLLFFEKLNYKKVCEVYQKLLKKYPQSKWAAIARERIELIRNNLAYPQALNDYILAEKYFEQGRYEKSIQSLVDIIEKYSQSALASESLYFLGDIYHFKLKDYGKAVDEYQNLIQNFPQNRHVANAQFKVGECCRKLEMWQEAIAAYKKFIEDYSQYGYSDYAQFYIGQCYEKLKDWKEAKDAYSLISTNYPESMWSDVARNRIKYLNRYLGG
jgi:TolA-binding protein